MTKSNWLRGRPIEHIGCHIADCNRKYHCRGFCRRHYQQWWRDCRKIGHKVDPETWALAHRSRSSSPKHTGCHVADCNGKHCSNGLCRRHYNQMRYDVLVHGVDPATWNPNNRPCR